jgi:autotransporter-associated beta strand protein
VAETKTVTVSVGTTTITSSLHITFTGPASATNSTVTASPASLPADNTTLSTVTVTLKDTNNIALGAGNTVSWTVSGTGNTVSPASSGTTIAGGVCTFTVKSSVVETKTVTVSVGATTITNSLLITFTTPPLVLKWDPLHNGISSNTNGVWGTNTVTEANWATNGGDIAWPNNSDSAIFGNGVNAGPDYDINPVVTIDTPITAGNLTFNNFNGTTNMIYQIVGSSPLTLGATTTIATYSDAQISCPLAGMGFTKTQAGTLILNATNTYSGGTTLNGGTLEVDSSGGLGTGLLTVNNSAGILSNNVSCTLNNPIYIAVNNTAFLKVGVGAGSTLTLGGAITNINPLGGIITNSFIKYGDGTLVISNAVYNGNTTVSGGILSVAGTLTNLGFTTIGAGTTLSVPGTFASVDGGIPGLQLNLGGTFDVAGTYTTPSTKNITVLGAMTVGGTMNFNCDNFYINYPANVSVSGVFNNNTTNAPIVGGAATFNVAGTYNSPNAGLKINGNGTLNFSGTTTNLQFLQMNNYSIINISGTMVCGILDAFGGGAIQLSDGTTAGNVLFKDISLNPAGSITGGSAIMSTLTISNANSIVMGPGFTIGDGVVNNPDPANNLNLYKAGSGTLAISNSVTSYTGNTTISGGTLELTYPTLATNSTVTVAGGAGLKLDFSDTNIVTSLVLNGTGATVGVHNNSTDPTYLTGTGSLMVLTGPSGPNPNPTNILFSITGNTLNLHWPADYLGWYMQSNSVALANTNYWFDVPNSQTVTNLVITLDASKTNVFFRMRKP